MGTDTIRAAERLLDRAHASGHPAERHFAALRISVERVSSIARPASGATKRSACSGSATVARGRALATRSVWSQSPLLVERTGRSQRPDARRVGRLDQASDRLGDLGGQRQLAAHVSFLVRDHYGGCPAVRARNGPRQIGPPHVSHRTSAASHDRGTGHGSGEHLDLDAAIATGNAPPPRPGRHRALASSERSTPHTMTVRSPGLGVVLRSASGGTIRTARSLALTTADNALQSSAAVTADRPRQPTATRAASSSAASAASSAATAP
jgi:hypothetical protein